MYVSAINTNYINKKNNTNKSTNNNYTIHKYIKNMYINMHSITIKFKIKMNYQLYKIHNMFK